MAGLPATWLLVGGALIAALELLTPGVLLVWIGAALMATGLGTLLIGLDARGQVLTFILLLSASVSGGLLLRKARPPADLTANRPDAGLSGRTGRTDGAFEGGRGRVRLGDTHWNARSHDGRDLPAGLLVRVRGVADGVLLVEAVASRRGSDGDGSPKVYDPGDYGRNRGGE